MKMDGRDRIRKGKARALNVRNFIDGEASHAIRREGQDDSAQSSHMSGSENDSSNIDELEDGEDIEFSSEGEEEEDDYGSSDGSSGNDENRKVSTSSRKQQEEITISNSEIDSDSQSSEEDSYGSQYLDRTIRKLKSQRRKSKSSSSRPPDRTTNKRTRSGQEDESSGEDIGTSSELISGLNSGEEGTRERGESSLLSDSNRNTQSRSVSVDPTSRKRVRQRSSSPDNTLPLLELLKTQKHKLSNWRQIASEERLLLTQRGGLIWQTAKPLLQEMDENKRGSIAQKLKMIMRSLDERLSKTPIPPTERMPKDIIANPEESSLRSRPMTGSLMSWIAETSGRIDQAGGNMDDPDRTLVEDVLKGFSADIAILESALIPEVDEVVNLVSTLEEQEKNLEEANETFERIKGNANKVDREAKEKARDVLDVLRDSMKKIETLKQEAPLSRAENFAICESAKASIGD